MFPQGGRTEPTTVPRADKLRIEICPILMPLHSTVGPNASDGGYQVHQVFFYLKTSKLGFNILVYGTVYISLGFLIRFLLLTAGIYRQACLLLDGDKEALILLLVDLADCISKGVH